ncbi:MAG TPA: BTAD domain-containing putative transcriptional regulator, partial [Pseudonocardiaceae bacterium]|nr:BTAD domain-containing putative transcriptional regulator [Pseudonocardiaceae bacterium]
TLLRRALTPIPSITITWQSTGYRLTTDHNTIDLHRFRTLVDTARTAEHDQRAIILFEAAMDLWRGAPFATLDLPWFDALRAVLVRERHAALLDLTDARLRTGQHGTLLPDLTDQADECPLDERLAGQLMLALYRSGRPADALARYRHIRERLAEELGADPGLPLQELHQRILTADPRLTERAPATYSAATPTPRQLPAAPRSFTGRKDELAVLSKVLDTATETTAQETTWSGTLTPTAERTGTGPTGAGSTEAGPTAVIATIAGAGGIGKTWLALHWAHQHRGRFPDGQLFVDLRGFSPDGQPTPTATALRGFLDALGVESASMPSEPEAQAALWRTLAADKRLLIVLDNAADTSQILPLLPSSPASIVLVTSRDHLSGLVTGHGAHPLPIDILDNAEARALLADRLGSARLAAEADAVEELLAFCSGFPLALSIVAGHAQIHAQLPLATLARELREVGIDALGDDDPAASLPAVLSWSYAALTEEQALVFCLLGVAPGPDISLRGAAALTGLETSAARVLLRALERASLIQQDIPGRWRMHDLIRRYAVRRCHADRSVPAQETALRRLLDFYLHTASAAERLLIPARQPIDLPAPAHGSSIAPLPDLTAAMHWLATEHRCLLAVQQAAALCGWQEPVWQLASLLTTFHWRSSRFTDNLAFCTAGVLAADAIGDPAIRNRIRRHLAVAHTQAGQYEDAMRVLREAMAIAEETGSASDKAETHRILSWVCTERYDDEAGLDHATRALALFRTLDKPVWVADLLNVTGWHSARLGHYQRARELGLEALALHRQQRERYRDGEATTLSTLAYVAQQTGQEELALDYYRQALAVFRELGDRYLESTVLDGVGYTYLALGRLDEAKASWQQAITFYRAQNRLENAERARRQIAELDRMAD